MEPGALVGENERLLILCREKKNEQKFLRQEIQKKFKK